MLDILGYILAGGVVLFLPGIAWWAWFPEKKRDILEWIAEIAGLSIAISALVVLGFFLLDWRLTPIGVGLIYAFLGTLAAAGILRNLVMSRRDDSTDDANKAKSQIVGAPQVEEEQTEVTGESSGFEISPPEVENASPAIESISPKAGKTPEGIRADHDQRDSRAGWMLRNASLLVVFVLLLSWRFYQVRDLVLPAWVDPLHHTLIVRLILENGGLPDSFTPYMPVTFSYHYAFHVVTAAFTFLTRLPAAQAVLVVGQVLNALVVVSIYRLGTALWGDWRRAGVAALLAGFVFQMPGYYATWGRYTLLTGLVLLPLTMAVALDSVRQKYATQRLVKLALLTSGVLLSHYFAALLLGLFLVLLELQVFLGDLRQGKRLRGSRWLPLALGVLTGAILASPWVMRLLGNNQEWLGVTAVSSAESMDSAFFPNYISYLWRMMGPRRNYILLALALLGLFVVLWRPKNRAFGIWALLLGLFSLPWGFHLSPFRPDHYVIVFFLPGSLLASEFIFTAWERLQRGRFRKVGTVLAGTLVIGLLIWGLRETRFIINQTTVFTNQADLDAIEWVAENTEPEARFLTNITHWQYNTYRGVDGGWWIMPLTGRETLLPPALYVMGERDYVEGINKYAETASQLQDCSPELWNLVEEAGVTHIYLVEGRGSLQSEQLEGCNGLSMVYARSGVTIYKVKE